VPVVIDADGLNHLIGHTALLKELEIPIVLTPHPGEMARLIGSTVAQVQQDRLGCARKFADEFNAHTILKGARTVIAHPLQGTAINPTGNAGMASGGMGDVLTGCIAGLITQGCSPAAAAQIGVFLHGAAADHLASTIGAHGYLATQVMNALPLQLDVFRQGQIKLADIISLRLMFG